MKMLFFFLFSRNWFIYLFVYFPIVLLICIFLLCFDLFLFLKFMLEDKKEIPVLEIQLPIYFFIALLNVI